MELNREQINKLIRQVMSEQVRIGTGIDFHSLYDGYPLVLAGVPIPHQKGFLVKRSDGDPVSHALVDALLAATNQGDIADWFDDADGTTNARSVEYLREIDEKLIKPQKIDIIHIQITLLAEKPKLKPFFPQMKREIARQIQVDVNRISIQGKTFEKKGIIGQEEGIGAQATVLLLI